MKRLEKIGFGILVALAVAVALWPVAIIAAIAWQDWRDKRNGRPGGSNLL